MKHILSIILAALLCATATAQTIRTLGYNSTNGVIVAATNVTWSNAFSFTTNAVAEQTRANLGFSTNLNTLWTATDAGDARSVLELSSTNVVNVKKLEAAEYSEHGMSGAVVDGQLRTFRAYSPMGNDMSLSEGTLSYNSVVLMGWSTNGVVVEKPLQFTNSTTAAQTRTNLSLGLPALTNTSNVTMMRALAGSTNTNEPYSGYFEYTDGTDTYGLSFSNGILLKQEGPL